MKTGRHPAFELFDQMFDAAAADEPIVNPGCFVERSVFYDRCRREGMEVTANPIEAMAWEDQIGLREFVRAKLRRYY